MHGRLLARMSKSSDTPTPHKSTGAQGFLASNHIRRAQTVFALVFFTLSCSEGEERETSDGSPAVELVATADMDFSKAVALVDEGTACVLLAYEPQVRCFDRRGVALGSFGSRGEGPGEFDTPDALVRGANRRIGVLDVGRSRITVWQPDGTYLGGASVPFLFKPVSSFDGTVLGSYEDTPDYDGVAEDDAQAPAALLAEVAIPSGEIVRKMEVPPPGHFGYEAECPAPLVQQGNMNSRGGIVFGVCARELMFWRSNGEAAFVKQPYEPGPLSERDVEEENEEYRRGLADILPPEMIEEIVESLHATESTIPYNWSRTRVHDGQDRLWVATVRDRIETSYFHVYSDTVFVGTVQVRDRLKAFDVLGSVLVVLVERKPGEGSDGIWRQALDWYELTTP